MDGIIIINKEKNCTSHDVVHRVKKIFGEKVGHTGTLDPNATGVLPVLIGRGTGLSKYLINHDKKYIATIKLGIKTSTADIEGSIIQEKKVELSTFNENNINIVFSTMIGKQLQKPPMYSAIKIKGKKLYEYARKGEKVEVPEREIEIYDLKLLEINEQEKLITFEIFCSKGTYIRSVCENIAERLNTVGYMLNLHRTMVGEFSINDSIMINELQENVNNSAFLDKNVISIENFFAKKPKVVLNNRKLELFLNGVIIDIGCKLKDDVARVYNEDNVFVGIGCTSDVGIKRDIIVL